MGFLREDLIPTNLRLAAANRGAIYVAGRTPITVLHMGGRDLWIRKNTNNGPPHGRTGSLDELPGGREFGRLRPFHLGQRFCQEF